MKDAAAFLRLISVKNLGESAREVSLKRGPIGRRVFYKPDALGAVMIGAVMTNRMNMVKLTQTARVIAALVLLSGCAGAQQNRPSPHATADVTLKGKLVTLAYGRPSMRGRKIVGNLLPFGQVWRTGADEATSFVTPLNLTMGGVVIPAGSYTLYSLPEEKSWKLIINKQIGQWGTEYDQSQDLVRIDMQQSKTTAPVEQFTISWTNKGPDKADLVLEWENTRLTVPVTAK
jgi:Protein of unknown function (DUF2911)